MDPTASEHDPARLEAAFRARAAELAARREHAAEEAGAVQALAFALGGERYALPLTDLAGVLPLGRHTPVPGGPPELLGLINHRGRVCCVIDLARLLGLPAGPHDGPGYVVLLRRPGGVVGLRVGAVEGLLRVAAGAAPPSEQTDGPASAFLRALTPDRLHLLSAEAILSHSLLSKGSPS